MTPPTVTLPTGAKARFFGTKSKDPAPTILIVHGWKGQPLKKGSSYETTQKRFAKLGYNSLLICLQGHEPAAGDIATVTREDHLADIRGALTWLRKEPRADGEIGGFGISYGAYLLAAACSETEFSFLAFRAPALYPDTDWTKPSLEIIDWPGLKAWRSKKHAVSESIALGGASTHAGPFALFLSQYDEFMPHAVAQSYSAAAVRAKKVKFVSPDTKHVLDEKQQAAFLESLASWITGLKSVQTSLSD